MYKILQVHDGENSFKLSVKTKLNVVISAVDVKRANVSLTVTLDSPGAEATITGVVVGKGEEQVALHTMQIHNAPDTTSDLLVKSVLSDRARFLYDGGIRVAPRAQKTNAYQRNENLLLSGRAYSESKPSLEILANDVRCTHGATAGPIDDDIVWYLASRGIHNAQAERLVTDGFIMNALMRIPDRSIMSQVCKTTFPNFIGR